MSFLRQLSTRAGLRGHFGAPLVAMPSTPTRRTIVLMPRVISEQGKVFLDQDGSRTKAHEETAEFWAKVTWYLAMPAVLISCIYSYKIFNAHMEHLEAHPPKFIPYSHLRIRNKKFSFGDGDHTLFHNPLVNPDPEE